MSDDSLILVPELLGYVPEPEARERGVAALRRFAPAADVSAHVADELGFVDCGENFERILCPTCGDEVDPQWWAAALDAARASGFERLAATTPCGHATTLHDLRYDWPQGFARFRLEAASPNRPHLSHDEQEQVEAAVGCRLRQILRHV